MKKIVEINNLTKTFCKGNICVANRLNLDINEGEVFTILGTSGSGKTTFLRMIAGLENPDSGEIKIDDKLVFSSNKNLDPKHREIAIVFQNYALLPHLNVSSNILFGSSASKKDLEYILEKTKLKGHEDKYPHELSGGQQQRVALARAIINKPKILLLDEPLSNIDTELRNILRLELKEMIKDLNITALFITHDKEDAFFLSDRIAIMNDGEILQVGTAQELYFNPKNLYCANFLGKITQISKNSYIRPEHIKISKDGNIEGIVKDIIFYGNFYELIVFVDNQEFLVHSFDDNIQINKKIKLHLENRVIKF
ncbi:ABC transporter ATP-binding protein [Arcobacter porcinus]|uniref:Iron(III)/spermidine/putrescine ABC transporter, ATP-binding protein n=1 Tax=Arcobacter porcinus TaxID=1935204 RepID=A0A5C2HAL1_9BACT|nr:ABC transporter ATP-binding protein [Arcobacter porcinus]OCL89583.1 Spermidine/putrescine import ATP-binding protein PotA [Aliarcobacter thereius]QEP39963.1 iron(III)/spermidine/putrescine ABC transporter, ATP-binding protein [Arcobacter porcinus]